MTKISKDFIVKIASWPLTINQMYLLISLFVYTVLAKRLAHIT